MKNFLIISCLMLAAEVGVFAQKAEPTLKASVKNLCDTSDDYEFFNRVRFIPVEVSAVTDGQVFWIFKGNKGIALGSFVLTEKSRVPVNFAGTYSQQKKWGIFYCSDTKEIILIDSLGVVPKSKKSRDKQ